MKRSTERFLTTHTGSLPRPDDLVRMMYAKEEGVPVDGAALAARIRAAVEEVVRKQVEAGVDLVNDGEMSKPSYATYVKDRLNGFGGTGRTSPASPIWRSACSATRAVRAGKLRDATLPSACATPRPPSRTSTT
jgi:methionine synthase II (cobalamin-independent)